MEKKTTQDTFAKIEDMANRTARLEQKNLAANGCTLSLSCDKHFNIDGDIDRLTVCFIIIDGDRIAVTEHESFYGWRSKRENADRYFALEDRVDEAFAAYLNDKEGGAK